ncbi:MAG: class III extradiol dioxygenase subunit B-like domain-containing protein [Candidatus Gastranaerophilales bacterium]|nr:class III extradiol dioxygenase subunit B-like domain-containing protein [Candidatus Gastranaerophilales bacterium]
MGNLLMATLCPHPPIIIPEVGGDECVKTQKTIDALQELSVKMVKMNPETVIVITPHSYYDPQLFTVYSEKVLEGGFSRFGAPQVKLICENDIDLIELIQNTIKDTFGRLNKIPAGASLDHGTCVPLYFLLKAGYKGKVVVINYTARSPEDHIVFGEKLSEAIFLSDRNIALVASGDLSHRLIPEAPAGYDPAGKIFDNIFVEAIKSGKYDDIINIDPALRIKAGECAFNSMMVALGLLGKKPLNNKVLSYEGPFGVGYLVASL